MVYSSKILGTVLSTIAFANPSAIAVFPTPASPTNIGLFFLLLDKMCMTRSNSLLLPTKGSIFPFAANSFKLTAYFRRSLSPVVCFFALLVSFCSVLIVDLLDVDGFFEIPWEIKFTTSSLERPFSLRKKTACESFSPKIATNTLEPFTSFLPEDCT